MAVQYREHFGFGGIYLPYNIDENGEDLVQWDGDESKWKCTCPAWERDSRCIHVYWAQGQEDVPVSGEYL